jgi:hypothetical protein
MDSLCGNYGGVVLTNLFVLIQKMLRSGVNQSCGNGGKENRKKEQRAAAFFQNTNLFFQGCGTLPGGLLFWAGGSLPEGKLYNSTGANRIFFHFGKTIRTENLLGNRIPSTFYAAQNHHPRVRLAVLYYNFSIS